MKIPLVAWINGLPFPLPEGSAGTRPEAAAAYMKLHSTGLDSLDSVKILPMAGMETLWSAIKDLQKRLVEVEGKLKRRCEDVGPDGVACSLDWGHTSKSHSGIEVLGDSSPVAYVW